MFTPELLAKAREGRKRAIPKAAYSAAIKNHCEQCQGVNPAITECGGHELLTGGSCRLYAVNTAFKRRKSTKTGLKRAIRQECNFCLCGSVLDSCSSPGCHFYAFGPGRLTRPAEPL
jgi:hypothetical protein